MNNMLTVLENKTAGIGSCILLEHNNKKILFDCGQYYSQTPASEIPAFPVQAGDIDTIILTHGHLGHCGLLPVLVRDGFKGKVYCTENCKNIAMFSLLENALLQEEEKQYWKYKHIERDIKPLYSEAEVNVCSPFFNVCDYHENIEISDGLSISFHNAGHSPGSALVKINLKDEDKQKNILLASDVGLKENDLNSDAILNENYNALLLPACVDKAEDEENIESKFANILNETLEAEGNIVIPVLSTDRRDAILELLEKLLAAGETRHLFACVDSPIAGKQIETLQQRLGDRKIYPCIQAYNLVEDSKELNSIRGTVIIISGYGRSGYGRIGMHLLKNINRPECSVVLFGDKHNHPLWRAIEKGEKTISILDRQVEIKAKIFHLNDPAIHWNSNSVLDWLQKIKSPPRHIYITHGQPEDKKSFHEVLEKNGNKEVKTLNSNKKITL